jgi:hypothetical protein
MTAGSRIPGLSQADLAAIDAIAAANLVTNRALQELARAMLDSPRADKARPKRSYRLTNVTKSADGEMTADVEYSDGRRRHFKMSRSADGELVGELDDGAPDAEPAPGTDDGSAPSTAPHAFDDIFGSVKDA